MAKNVIMPALGIAQETGKIVRWLKNEGEQVTQGDTLAEIETDKAVVDLASPATGTLASVTAAPGVDIPVGQVIATILAAGESAPAVAAPPPSTTSEMASQAQPAATASPAQNGAARQSGLAASPLASRIAAEHNLDISQVKPAGRRIQRADVLAYLQSQEQASAVKPRLVMASPKARRLAAEQGKDLASIKGSGPEGAVLAADVLAETVPAAITTPAASVPTPVAPAAPTAETVETAAPTHELTLSHIWRLMAERTTQSWTGVPHFFLEREVRANRLITWREQLLKRSPAARITYTDLLVKVVAAALREHPRLNASWSAGTITVHNEVNIGLAIATEEGLVAPVIHHADTLGLREIARRRTELVERAQAGKLHLQDLRGGTFTISNLGMYGVDAFNAIINAPQAAILAVGRIAERVIAVDGQPSVQPCMHLTLSCDHRVIDGARGAQFLAALADLLEEPLGLLE